MHGRDDIPAIAGNHNVVPTLATVDLVLANSAGTATRSQQLGARATLFVQPSKRRRDPVRLQTLGQAAGQTVAREFAWGRCGRETSARGRPGRTLRSA